jgi:hypothetical protein
MFVAASSVFFLAAAFVATRITNTRGEPADPEVRPEAAPAPLDAKALELRV